jgi:hypothetical protein
VNLATTLQDKKVLAAVDLDRALDGVQNVDSLFFAAADVTAGEALFADVAANTTAGAQFTQIIVRRNYFHGLTDCLTQARNTSN